MELRAITWNLFHGRDWPPEPELQVARWRFSGRPIRGASYVQVNRDLFDQFAAMIVAAEWEVGLFQEFPPAWRDPLARACGAEAHRVLTGRNLLLALTSRLGRWRPDLMGASAGGSNTTLVRPAAGPIAARDRFTVCRRPERRVVALTRLESGICVANLHVSTAVPSAERDLIAAAERATEFAGGDPLIFGGDYNVRPQQSEIFELLAERFGLAPPTAPDRLSHLLVRGLEVVEHPAAWPPEARDVEDRETALKLRLADHNPVQARFARVR